MVDQSAAAEREARAREKTCRKYVARLALADEILLRRYQANVCFECRKWGPSEKHEESCSLRRYWETS